MPGNVSRARRYPAVSVIIEKEFCSTTGLLQSRLMSVAISFLQNRLPCRDRLRMQLFEGPVQAQARV